MSQENVQLIRGLYEAFGKGDVATVLGKSNSPRWSHKIDANGSVRRRPRYYCPCYFDL